MANRMRKEVSKSYERHWILYRRAGESKTLVFTVTVEIEEDPDKKGSYLATIKELPATITAVEGSALDAQDVALRLFQSMVDHSLDKNTLKELLSDATSDIMRSINRSFDECTKILNEKRGGAAQDWVTLKAA